MFHIDYPTPLSSIVRVACYGLSEYRARSEWYKWLMYIYSWHYFIYKISAFVYSDQVNWLDYIIFLIQLFFLYSDQVAVPDYPSGATEHWGLITYRESRLLYDARVSGASDKQAVAEIVAHELAHNVSKITKNQLHDRRLLYMSYSKTLENVF